MHWEDVKHSTLHTLILNTDTSIRNNANPSVYPLVSPGTCLTPTNINSRNSSTRAFRLRVLAIAPYWFEACYDVTNSRKRGPRCNISTHHFRMTPSKRCSMLLARSSAFVFNTQCHSGWRDQYAGYETNWYLEVNHWYECDVVWRPLKIQTLTNRWSHAAAMQCPIYWF